MPVLATIRAALRGGTGRADLDNACTKRLRSANIGDMRSPLDHAAFLTWDTAATHDFYTKVMGWPLIVAWGRQEGEQPFFISGYDAGGWTIEFEEQVGIPRGTPPPAPWFPHFGLLASSDEEFEAWKQRLDSNGVKFAHLGSDLMFTDPNGVAFQVLRKAWHGAPEELAPLMASNYSSWVSFRQGTDTAG
jgi:catechol 2,3-dioxygenase-like lactoylglutathione lyase family enzyme